MDCIDIYDNDCDTYIYALEIHKIQFEKIQYHEMKGNDLGFFYIQPLTPSIDHRNFKSQIFTDISTPVKQFYSQDTDQVSAVSQRRISLPKTHRVLDNLIPCSIKLVPKY